MIVALRRRLLVPRQPQRGFLLNPFRFGGGGGGGGDALVALDFEGADGATSTTDTGTAGKSWTFNAGAEIDTAQFKYGSSSLFCNSGSIQATNGGTFDFGSDDWCFECYFRQSGTTASSNGGIFSRRASAVFCPVELYYNSSTSQFRFFMSGSGNSGWAIIQDWYPTIANNTWYHLALERFGSNIRLFIDGVQFGTTVTAVTMQSSTQDLWIGRGGDGVFRGWIDRFRIYDYAPYEGASFSPP